MENKVEGISKAVYGAADMPFSAEHFSAVFCSHSCAEAHFSPPFDFADAWIFHSIRFTVKVRLKQPGFFVYLPGRNCRIIIYFYRNSSVVFCRAANLRKRIFAALIGTLV